MLGIVSNMYVAICRPRAVETYMLERCYQCLTNDLGLPQRTDTILKAIAARNKVGYLWQYKQSVSVDAASQQKPVFTAGGDAAGDWDHGLDKVWRGEPIGGQRLRGLGCKGLREECERLQRLCFSHMESVCNLAVVLFLSPAGQAVRLSSSCRFWPAARTAAR